jgi:hypothetical protein
MVDFLLVISSISFQFKQFKNDVNIKKPCYYKAIGNIS